MSPRRSQGTRSGSTRGAHRPELPSWLLFRLDRPQYPPSPEILQSSLAWSLFSANPGMSERLVFVRRASTGREGTLEETIPTADPELRGKWEARVREQGFPDSAAGLLLEAIGCREQDDLNQLASPMSPALALLQTAAGAMSSSRPPNFANIIETSLAAGLGARPQTRLAATLWYEAGRRRCHRLPLVAFLDSNLHDLRVGKLVGHGPGWPPSSEALAPAPPEIELPPWWTREIATRTPFGWFARAWPRLCGEEWTAVLPPRRWADWASAVLRTGLAFAFIWEANFFRAIGRAILRKQTGEASCEHLAASEAMFRLEPVLPWDGTEAPVEGNVYSRLRATLRTGLTCRKLLVQAVANHSPTRPPRSLEDAIAEVLRATREDDTLVQSIRSAFAPGNPPPGFNNLWEFVIYSLQARGKKDSGSDPNGFLRPAGQKTLLVEPGPEWLVVLAALAAPGPGRACRLADLLVDLGSLGLQPRMAAVIAELKRVGLCEGSPDADEGILVHSPFPSPS